MRHLSDLNRYPNTSPAVTLHVKSLSWSFVLDFSLALAFCFALIEKVLARSHHQGKYRLLKKPTLKLSRWSTMMNFNCRPSPIHIWGLTLEADFHRTYIWSVTLNMNIGTYLIIQHKCEWDDDILIATSERDRHRSHEITFPPRSLNSHTSLSSFCFECSLFNTCVALQKITRHEGH